jgi:predicted DNA binding protein
MVRAVVEIRLSPDTWIGRVSRSKPDAEYRLQSGLPTEESSIELGEVIADDPAAAAHAVRDDRSVTSYELLGVDDDRAVSVYETTDRGLYKLTLGFGVPPEYPVVARDGTATLEFETTREGVSRIVETLDERDVPHELLSLTGSSDDSALSLLSDRQREVVAAALERGYYSVPRECTLGDVADHLDVDPSTVSDVVRRAERNLVQWHFDVTTTA